MPAETQALFVYWPAGAFAAALVASVFAAGWFSVTMKRLVRNLAATRKNRQDLVEARATSKQAIAKVKVRRAEMVKLNEMATKLFWRNEKTWIG